MLEEEKHERPQRSDPLSEGSEKVIRVQPLCDCAFRTVPKVVVFTCPECMGVAFRAIKELVNG